MLSFINDSCNFTILYLLYIRICILNILTISLVRSSLLLKATYPCTDTSPIRWVRDDHVCSRYYICYRGRPIRMPECNNHLVWSNVAKTCVKRGDRFDDCNEDINVKLPQPTTLSTRISQTTASYPSTFLPSKYQNSSKVLHSSTLADSCQDRKLRVAHHIYCHIYYECSTKKWHTCRFPALYDSTLNHCTSFTKVTCGKRLEPDDECQYTSLECASGKCPLCLNTRGCKNKRDGIYPLSEMTWTNKYITCYHKRLIARDICKKPYPIFSPEIRDCVSLYYVPKTKEGLRPDCSYRKSGWYPDEQGSCTYFFECQHSIFISYMSCPNGLVYNPDQMSCRTNRDSALPCGDEKKPNCSKRKDGFYADPYGRCPFYFECHSLKFVRYYACDKGFYDTVNERCTNSSRYLFRPCGVRRNPCQNLTNGYHRDASNGCVKYIECQNQILVKKSRCNRGLVFDETKGECVHLNLAPPPCGSGSTCKNRGDGRYGTILKGCQYYFICIHGNFMGYRRCTYTDGGLYFNRHTGKCDMPQNICAPCGYRWYHCR